MNKPISFELAKLLKQKNIVIKPLSLRSETDYVEGYDWDIDDEEDELKVREFQFEDNVCSHLFLSPTVGEVVMWLYENHGIWIYPILHIETKKFLVNIDKIEPKFEWQLELYNSPTEAYKAAIEYTLNNLL